MFKRILLLLFILFSMHLHSQKTSFTPENQLIDTGWSFRQAHSGEWRTVDLPVSVHTALLRHGVIDDPYYRDNELKLQWIEKEDWEFKTEFMVSQPSLEFKHVELVLDGLDTYAKVFVNDSLVLEADNMFRSWRVDVKPFLKVGKNELHIYFESAINKVQPEWEALGYELPGGERTMTRKGQFHYGWDWGPRFVGAGILKTPRLIMWDDVLLEDVYVQPKDLTDERARMEVHMRYRSDFTGEVSLITRYGKTKIIEKRTFREGEHEETMTFDIDEPRLWWCRGMGEPYLYDIRLQVKKGYQIIENRDVRFGIRTIELVTEPDDQGNTFYFRLNGKPVFAKGANIIPQDLFQDRVEPGRYKKMIEAAEAAHMNMLRVWGGGIYEDDVFYQLCDARGILVWQDFMYACAMYPGSGSFLKNASREAFEQIERLRQHPCIALWCGNNENNEAWHNWGWQMKFSEAQRARVWKDYQTLFKDLLPTYVENYALGVPYWESSPMHGRLNAKSMKEGDAHYWGVWHDEEPFEVLNHKIPRFMSEFGFQAFPSWETVEAFTTPEDRKLDSPVMQTHQKHPRGNALIAEYMKREYGVPGDFEDFVYLSQVLQAEGMRIGLEAHRRNKPYCMGTLYWQLNDVWPVASWSSIDYYGRWKAMHYAVQESFAPVAVLPFMDGDQLQVYTVSDRPDTVTANLSIQLVDLDGKVKEEVKLEHLQLLSDAARLRWEADLNKWAGKKRDEYLVWCRLTDAEGQLLHQRKLYFAPAKKLKLPNPKITIEEKQTEDGIEMVVRTNKLARNIYLRSSVDGAFSHNFFDLLPGESRTVMFRPADSAKARPTFSAGSLIDAIP